MRVLCLLLWCLAGLIVDAPAQAGIRLVSLSPNLTELLFDLELSEHLVGRSSACDYPAAALAIPVVGAFGRPNQEALWQQRPEVVLVTDLEKPGILQPLTARGIQVRVLPCESWRQLEEAVQTIAELVDQPALAQEWIERQRQRRQQLSDRVSRYWGERTRFTVYAEVWGSPLTSVGGHTFVQEVIELAGGRNIGAALHSKYPTISAEWVMQENPQVILLAYMLADMRPADALRRRLGWHRLEAVQRDRIIDDIPPDLLLRPGPRLLDGAEQLATRLMQLDRADAGMIDSSAIEQGASE